MVQVGISFIKSLYEPYSQDWTSYLLPCFESAMSFYFLDVIYSVYCDIKSGPKNTENVVREEKIEAKIAEEV